MQIIFRVIFTASFTAKADRDAYQAKITLQADKTVADLGLKSRVASGPDITGPTEIGYCWFTNPGQEAVWASRLVVGFSDKSEADLFAKAMQDIYLIGLPEEKLVISFYTDSTGKQGAFNQDIVAILEPTDRSQMDLK